jgi:predicted 3-demethylubiquinone-9 3-methyltransferase (glyoxalase superfamily)
MPSIQKITPCLWFDDQAEAAAALYTSVFKDSRVLAVSRYGEAGREVHGRPPGSVMTVSFELEGQAFTALNGGPVFTFNEAVSFQVSCDTQEEVDHYWSKLAAGGDERAQQCGWLKDRYGVSWQIVPTVLPELLTDPDPGRASRTMQAMLQMKKLDIAALKRAHAGQPAATDATGERWHRRGRSAIAAGMGNDEQQIRPLVATWMGLARDATVLTVAGAPSAAAHFEA